MLIYKQPSERLEKVGLPVRIQNVLERVIKELAPAYEASGVPFEVMRAGILALQYGLARLALEAGQAETMGIGPAAAARDARFPELRRFHLAVFDLLTLELPPEAQRLVRHAIQIADREPLEEARRFLARIASDVDAERPEKALARFLLFEIARINAIVLTWDVRPGLLRVGIDDDVIDRTAEAEMRAFTAHPEWLDEPEPVRPVQLLAAGCLMRLAGEYGHLVPAVASFSEELRGWYERRAQLDALLRDMDSRDGLLIRNFFAPHFEEQRLTVERLISEHSIVYEGAKRNTLDKRLSRMCREISRCGANGLPVRKAPALIDILASCTEEE